MYCRKCGAEIDDKAVICVKCGNAVDACGAQTIISCSGEVSPCSRLAAFLLCFFLGVLGIHRFYVGKIGSAIAMIFTLGGLGIWVLVDWIMILAGAFKDNEGRTLVNWTI